MNIPRINRRFAAGFLAALLLLTAGFSFAAAAQQMPAMAVLTSEQASCELIKQERGAVVRGGAFAIEVQGLQAGEPVFTSLVFPDGRVYSPAVAQVDGPGGLDGVSDTPADPGFTGVANNGGDYFAFFQTTDKWPRGCYVVTALGGTSQIITSAYVVVKDPAPAVISAGQLSLVAQNRATRQSSGPQGTTIDLFGRGFLSEETIQLRMTQPDGTVISLGAPAISLVGSFQIEIPLTNAYQTGEYRFTATSGSGYTVSAPFTLVQSPIATRGFGRIRISRPFPPVLTQGQDLELQGKNFAPGESVTCRLIQPNGATSTLMSIPVNELGEFTVSISLDRQLRTGTHTLLLESPSTIATTTFSLLQGATIVPPAAMTGPNAWLPTSAPAGQATSAAPTGQATSATPAITPGKGDPLTPTPADASTTMPTTDATSAPTATAEPAITPGKGDPLPTAAPAGSSDSGSYRPAAAPTAPPAPPPPATPQF